MLKLIQISDGLSWVCKMAARLAAGLLLVLTLVIMYDVIGRRFFATGSTVLQELEWHIHGVIAVFGFGFAYTRNAHVRIDVLADRMSDRFKLRLEFAAIVFLLVPFFLFIAWYGIEFAERAYLRGEGANGGRGLPYRWIIKSAVPISALLTVMGALSVALRCLVILRRPDLLKSPFEDTGLWTR